MTTDRHHRRITRPAIGGLLAVIALSGCGGDGDGGGGGEESALAAMQESGTADVALAANPPYSELSPSGEATGYVPALALEILGEHGVDELNASVAEFEGLIPGLQAGRWDVITTGLSVTPERCETILFSEPTVVQQETLTVPAGNPENITSHQYFLDHKDATLAVLTGSSQQQYAVQEQQIPEDQILAVGEAAGLADALVSGRADAFAIGQVSAQTATMPYEDEVDIVPLDYIPVYGTAFGFRTSDGELRDAFNEGMEKLHESGELEQLYEEWGYTNYDLLAETSLSDLVDNCE